MTPQSSAEASVASWLRFNSVELNPVKSHVLLKACGYNPEAVLAMSDSDMGAAGVDITASQRKRLRSAAGQDVAKALDTMAALNAQCLTVQDPGYPVSLKELPDAPPCLFVRGDLRPDDRFSVAIVGSRRASSYGLSLAEHFAKELGGRGLAVVSGGARGVDTRAHKGAIDGGGRTIAFTGCGLDITYPAENKALFERIVVSGGAIVSEYGFGTRPEPWRFPARNRLISGLSLGVLVVESPVNSGSLITAREAADQGREVFAVPGPIDTGRNSGCHRLIKDGAKLVETVEDILDELGVLSLQSDSAPAAPGVAVTPVPADLPQDQRDVLALLDLQPRVMDQLIGQVSLAPAQVVGILTLLEMRGLAKRVAGNAFVRVLK